MGLLKVFHIPSPTLLKPAREGIFNVDVMVHDAVCCPKTPVTVQQDDNCILTVAWLTISLSDSNCKMPWIGRSQEFETS